MTERRPQGAASSMDESLAVQPILAQTRRSIHLLMVSIGLSVIWLLVALVYPPEVDLGCIAWCTEGQAICTRDGWIGGPQTEWRPAPCPCQPNLVPEEGDRPPAKRSAAPFVVSYVSRTLASRPRLAGANKRRLCCSWGSSFYFSAW